MTGIKLQKFLAYVLVRLETISHCWFRTMLEQSSSPLRSEFLAPRSISPCNLLLEFCILGLYCLKRQFLMENTVPLVLMLTAQLNYIYCMSYNFSESQSFAHLHLTFTLEDAAINHKFGEFLEFACFANGFFRCDYGF